MPTLTIRSLGEMLYLPMYQQLRMLTEQKYPNQEPAAFRVPFYSPAMAAIRRYYRESNSLNVLDAAIAQVQASTYLQQRKTNNVAVITAFRQGQQRTRDLTPVTATGYTANLAGLQLRFTPDLIATENGTRKYLIYDCRAVAPTQQIARTVVDLANYVLQQNGVELVPRDVELVSLRTDQRRRFSTISQTSINRAQQNAAAIIQLWPTL